MTRKWGGGVRSKRRGLTKRGGLGGQIVHGNSVGSRGGRVERALFT